MLSRSLHSNASARVVRSLARFQSTATAVEVETKKGSKPVRKFAEREGNQFTSSLYNILNEEFTEFSPYFEQVKSAFEKGSEQDKSKAINSMHALSSKMISKILDIKKTTKSDVSNSILYREIITLLAEDKILPVGTFNRYIEVLLSEKKYMAALTFWIENANYFKSHPKSFPNARKDKTKTVAKNDASAIQRDAFVELNYHLNGLVAYLASLIENKDLNIDPEFIKLIFGDKKPVDTYRLSSFVARLNLDAADAKIINDLYSKFEAQSFDINAEKSLKSISRASFDGKLVYLNDAITKNLNAYKGKEADIKPETIAHYMKCLNEVKLYSRSIEIWKFASQHKIPVEIGVWNQLLKAFSNLNIADSEVKVNSVWNLLNKSIKPNSESYSIYVSYLMKNKLIEKVKTIIENIKSNSPELFDSSLKCSMVEILLQSKNTAEAYQLFKIYQKQDDFVPNIGIYNKLITKFVGEKNYETTQELLNELLSNKYSTIQPDTATWTTIVDFLLKSATKSNLSKEEIVHNLFAIIKNMESTGVKLNSVALMTVAADLLKNPNTADLGMNIFEKIEMAGIKLNAVAYSGIVTTFTARGEIQNALVYYNKAINGGILPSAFFYNSILKGFANAPDVTATREFMKPIKAMIKANPAITRLTPNQFTFYFLLLQGIRANDSKFVNEVLDDLSNTPVQMSDGLVKVLRSLKTNGYTIPDSLASKLN